MNNLKCPNCGGKLDKSPRGEYIYTCQFCGIDVDIQQHLSVDLDSKKRYCKAAYTHIQNGNLRNAEIMLERLELEYPFDKEVQDLRRMYDEEQDRLKREREQREYDKKREDIINEITKIENDIKFWQTYGWYLGSELDRAVELLDKSEEYEIDCLKFRAFMWSLFEDVRNGKLFLNLREDKRNGYLTSDIKEIKPQGHKYYNMFIMANNLYGYKEMQKEIKQALIDSHNKWKNEIKKKIIRSFITCFVLAIVMFILSETDKSQIIIDMIFVIGFFGILFFFLGLVYVLSYKSRNNIFRRILLETNQQEELESKFNKVIEGLQEKIEETQVDFEKVESEYKEITFNKAAAWIEENEDLLRERKGE
jgi:hypothetical protein